MRFGRGYGFLAGFSLAELMLATAILSFVLVGLLLLFVNCTMLNEANRNLTLVYSAIETKMEELKNEDFTQLAAHDAEVFDLSGFAAGDGKGKITVTGGTDLKTIKILACYMNRNRLIGDDIDNCQSSPVELQTQISR